MTDIKELALRVASEMGLEPFAEINWTSKSKIEFATRLFAARDAEAVPVAWMFPDDEEQGYIAYQGKPPTQEQVDYLAKWNRPTWIPLFTHPAPVAVPEWQPIETAPKDTNILLFGRWWSDKQGWMNEPVIGRWNEYLQRWESCNAGGWWGIRPTVWQPLPKAPKEES